MKNPWNKLQCVQNQYYLEQDHKIILHNNQTSVNTDTHVDLGYLPQPFIGNKDSRLYLLLANPGRIKNESNLGNVNAEMKEAILKNLKHEKQDFPFYPLNHRFIGTTVYKWWETCLGELMRTLDVDEKILANNFFTLWLYGYHTYQLNQKLLEKEMYLTSIDYTAHLVNKAIKEKKIILIGRSVASWFALAPKLKDYDHCFFVANIQKMILSETTLPPPTIKLIRKVFKD